MVETNLDFDAKLIEKLETLISEKGLDIRFNEVLAPHTSYNIGGPADIFYSPEDIVELQEILALAQEYDVEVTILGLGSNVLVSDKGIRGLVISFNEKFSKKGFLNVCPEPNWDGVHFANDNIKDELSFDEDGYTYLYVEAGEALKELSRYAARNSLTGLEFSCGIPGSVGGAIYMNAGAYGGTTDEVCIMTYYLDQDYVLRAAVGEEQNFAYRQSLFHQENGIILASIYKLKTGNKEAIDADIAEFTRRREASQPLELPSCGSVFKRPVGHFAGKLIMDSELQGHRVGGAEVSKKHAGFIVNVDNATATDVYELIKHVQAVVWDKYHVELETEVRFVGEW